MLRHWCHAWHFPHQRAASQADNRRCRFSCVMVRQTAGTNSNTSWRGGTDTEPRPNNTGGATPSVVHAHRIHQGQQLFVAANSNYSLDRHEKASALTSNTKSHNYKAFIFPLCLRCQHSRRSSGAAQETAER